ncbi:flippase (plasmid) [Halolamina sp. CBA1230]|uniref:flippase n=1 Tax=Halolamina sp. CBA1230 TaxID=1853690 RepID=UPI0009A167DB|nr:flippase [Halolamina sp. CBA1230]QKY22032.1 flippase [Halolamina sp. CBA1230]
MDIARSSVKLFVSKTASSILGFAGIAYFSRELGAATMGVFFLFQALLGMLTIPSDFGLRGAAQKRISEGNDPGKYLSSTIILKLVPITTIIVLIIIFRPYINGYLGANLALLLVIALVIQELARLSLFVLRGELRVGQTAIFQLIKQATWVGIGGVFLSLGYGAVGLVYGLITGSILTLVIGWCRTSTSLSRPTKKHMSSLFEYSKYNVITSIGGYFYSWIDVAIIGLFLTQAHVGAYEVAWRVTAVTMLLGKSIATTLLPQVSQWSVEGDDSNIESAIYNAITPSMLFVIPSFFGVVVFSKEILGIVFGAEFTIAWLAFIILMAEKLLQSIHVILSRVIMGLDRPEMAAKATVASVLVNLCLNLAFIPIFGLVGAALATGISFVLNTILHGYYLSTLISIKIPYLEVGWCTIAAIGMAFTLLWLKTMIPISGLIQLFGMIIFGATIYLTLILSSSTLRSKLRTQATNLIGYK